MSTLAAARRRSVLLVVVSLALLYAMRASIPNYDGMTGPVVERGAFATWTQGRRLAARADAVTTARVVRYAKSGAADVLAEHDTSGVWLVVDATARGVTEPVTLMKAQIETRDGRRYARTERLGIGARQLSAVELQPGIDSRGVLVFELPADALVGTRLVLADTLFPLLDSELSIDLAIATAPKPADYYDMVRR